MECYRFYPNNGSFYGFKIYRNKIMNKFVEECLVKDYKSCCALIKGRIVKRILCMSDINCIIDHHSSFWVWIVFFG